MTETAGDRYDIPESDRGPAASEPDISTVDPGADVPPRAHDEPGLGEDPAYDPGGMGRQPDVVDDAEAHR